MIVYKCGQSVRIKLLEMQGFITGIVIRNDNIQYAISYFTDGKYTETWFYEYEIDFTQTEKKITIGYKG